MRTALSLLLLLAAAYWVITPADTAPPELGVPTAPATKLTTQATGPIEYGYRPACQGDIDDPKTCDRWHLVGRDGRRWWLPRKTGESGPLALSPDGTLAAYHTDDLVIRRLLDGKTTPVTPRISRSDGDTLLFSPDVRFLGARSGKRLTITDLTSGAQHRVKVGGDDVLHGWTAKGVVLTTTRPSDKIPGHLWATDLTEIGPDGTTLRRVPIPSNLADHLAISPDGRTAASAMSSGLALVDLTTGKATRSLAVPGLRSAVRWLGADRVLVRTTDGHLVVDVATGTTHPRNAAPDSLLVAEALS
ncbi:hypothetical protein [Nonomuraea sp. NPDC046570]|uniref:hypothetical protein n=1 Tax=Nonomuraea sp. NPDC046570 TaxID=3155255 RepID=UPI00340D30F6